MQKPQEMSANDEMQSLMDLTLRLHRAGVLETRMLEWILRRMQIIRGGTRGAIGNILSPRHAEPEHPLLCATDLPDEIDRRLDRAERVVYNYLLKTDACILFTHRIENLLVRALPEVASMQQADRKDLVFEVMQSIRSVSRKGSIPTVGKYHGFYWELCPKVRETAA